MKTAAALCACFLACELPVDPLANVVRNLRFVPSAFDSFTGNTEIRYTLDEPQLLSIYILRPDSIGLRLVKTLARDISETKGFHAHTWLGDNDNRQFVPAGVYIGIVEVRARSFEAAVEIFHF